MTCDAWELAATETIQVGHMLLLSLLTRWCCLPDRPHIRMYHVPQPSPHQLETPRWRAKRRSRAARSSHHTSTAPSAFFPSILVPLDKLTGEGHLVAVVTAVVTAVVIAVVEQLVIRGMDGAT